jgi:vitamin B12 transporter
MTQTQKSLCPAFRLAGITLISSGMLHGADTPKDKPVQELPATVVTATKTETEADKTASSITVIDRAKIEQEQYRLLADALRIVPGMTVINPGVTGNVATVLTRGTATKDTMLLIDGRPMPYNLAGSFNLETMALDNVERVEVLRGPAASLYGGRTMGGVINVITRSGRGLEKPETTAFFEAGSYGTFREGVSTLGAAGDLDWGFEASRTDIQGQRINSQFQQSNAAGKIGYQIADDLRFDLDLRYYTADVGVPGSTAANDPDNHLLTEFWSISPRLIWDTTENWRQTLTFSHSEFRQVATGFTGFFQTNNRVSSRNDWLEYQSTVKVLDVWTITAGAWFQDQNITRYNDSAQVLDIDQNQTNWALFLQSQAEVLPGLNLLGGLRYDSFSDFEEAVTWRAGISYRVPVLKTLLHANYGTAYTPPTPQDLTPVFGGNPNLLDPERSRGYEIGIEQPLLDNQLLLNATWFRNDIEDTYQYLPPLFIPQAVGEATTSGVESGIQWTPCQSFSANLNYTYLDATDDTNDARLVRRPRHSINGGISVKPHDDVTVSLSAVYVIDREDFTPAGQADVEDFLNVRLSATWRVTKNVEVFGRIENLLGDQYEEIPGFPALDTGAYAGVKLRF